jgi:hypothetical protein
MWSETDAAPKKDREGQNYLNEALQRSQSKDGKMHEDVQDVVERREDLEMNSDRRTLVEEVSILVMGYSCKAANQALKIKGYPEEKNDR